MGGQISLEEAREIAEMLGPIYPFLRTMRAWMKVADNNKPADKNFTAEMLNAGREVASHYNIKAEDVAEAMYKEYLPEKYHGAASVFTRRLMRMQWDDTVDMATEFVKEYGADSEGDGYRMTSEVIEEIMAKYVTERLTGVLFEG
jgi:hypothetical protein